jgi:hypothetical protein
MKEISFNLLTLLTFFYGIFWASTIDSNSKYKPFDPTGFFSKEKEAYKIRRRFYFSVLLLDLIPISYFAFIFNLFMRYININELNWLTIILTGFTSLSVFGFTRLAPAVIASNKTHKYFYTTLERPGIIDEKPNSFKAYLFSGIIYLVIPFFLILIMHLSQNGWLK